jgi:transposase
VAAVAKRLSAVEIGARRLSAVAIIDSQSVKTTGMGGQRGFDAGKKIKGRKRHIAVDTQGNLLTVIVHSAGIQDRVAARAVLIRLFVLFTSIKTVFADGGYTGKLTGWAKDMAGWVVQVVRRNEAHTFKVLPKRWSVERTFAWLGWSRRLSNDVPPVLSSATIWSPLPPLKEIGREEAVY